MIGSPQTTLAGFDFPIGVPAAYARKANISRFTEVLEVAGTGESSDFYRVCDKDVEISLHRPFYPRVSSSTARQAHLVCALGVDSIDMLRRTCERQTETRKAACSLFWTLGGNQVGKAAISGWRTILQPAMREGAMLWPFDGSLAELSQSNRLVLCETYPAEAYGHIGVRFATGASKQAERPACGKRVFDLSLFRTRHKVQRLNAPRNRSGVWTAQERGRSFRRRHGSFGHDRSRGWQETCGSVVRREVRVRRLDSGPTVALFFGPFRRSGG
jgi:hypothetical protein